MHRRAFGLFAGVVFVLASAAGPAAADPAEPTNYISTITSLDPDDGAVSVEVTGGDAFLVLTAARGHSVEIPGYSGEPYVRIDPDGSVWINLSAPTHYINDERYGRVEIPREADADAAPRWERVSTGGTYAWHDHRTHWMSLDRPPGVGGAERQVVFPWKIPIIVDGGEVEVSGLLEWLPDRTPWPPALVGLIVVAALLAITRRSIRTTAPLAVMVAAMVAIGLDLIEAFGTPTAARVIPTAIVFPVLSAVAAGTALWKRTSPPEWRWALLAASLILLAWTAMSLDALTRPVLISPVPDVLERVLVPVIGWTGVGGLLAWAAEFRGQFQESSGRTGSFGA